MRKIMSLGIATTLVLVAIGAWATAMAGPSIDPFEMMMKAKDLPVQQYDMS